MRILVVEDDADLNRQLVTAFKQSFRVVKAIKPKASRDKSSETFLVGIGLKTR